MFDTYLHRKTKQTGWKKWEKRRNKWALQRFQSLLVRRTRPSVLHQWKKKSTLRMDHWHSNDTVSLSHAYGRVPTILFCRFASSTTSHNPFLALLNQEIHEHDIEVKQRRSKSNMFSLEVMFLPSVESLLNQQRRSKMHRSYHRRNMHRYCTYSISQVLFLAFL